MVGAVFAARRRDRDALAFVGLVFVTFFAAAYSISRVAGPLAGYLVRWLLVLGMVSWLAAAWALWPALRRMRVGRGGRAVLVIVAGVALAFPTVASVVDAARSRGPWYRTGVVEAQLARDTVAHLHTDGRPVLLRSDHERWWTWGLAPRLEAAGIPVAARQQDVLYYGRHRVARFHEARVAVVVVVGADARTTGRPAGGRLLAFHQGAHLPALGYGATASQSEVLRAVERDFLDRTIAVYEVPL